MPREIQALFLGQIIMDENAYSLQQFLLDLAKKVVDIFIIKVKGTSVIPGGIGYLLDSCLLYTSDAADE